MYICIYNHIQLERKMKVLFAKKILLASGWHENVRIEVNSEGIITSIQANEVSFGASMMDGPVIPGMPNLHSHSFQRLMAGLSEIAGNPNDSFWTWREIMYRLVQHITPDQMYDTARYLFVEMLKAGYTSVAEFHYVHNTAHGQQYHDQAEISKALLRAAADVGISITLLPVLYTYSGFNQAAPLKHQKRFILNTEQYLNLFEDLKQFIHRPTQNLGLCFHSLRAVSQDQIDTVLNTVKGDHPIHIHISEQQKEVDQCIDFIGQRPIKYLYDIADVNQQWSLIHATHCNANEIQLMAKSGAVAGLCITTEANLGDGIFPMTDYLQLNGNFGIGSDSHVSVSVAEELRWLEYTQRLRDQRRNRVHQTQYNHNIGETIYQKSLLGGAQSLGQNIGRLEVGARADFLVFNAHDPFIATASDTDLINRWIFGRDDSVIQDVFVAGEQVVFKRHHQDDDAIREKFTAVIRSIIQ